MGHDIYARSIIVQDDIAYLRRNMGSNTIHILYEALGVPQLDAGVSGYGSSQIFTKYGIENAYKEIKKATEIDDEDRKDYLEFLSKILEEIGEDKERKILIDFH